MVFWARPRPPGWVLRWEPCDLSGGAVPIGDGVSARGLYTGSGEAAEVAERVRVMSGRTFGA